MRRATLGLLALALLGSETSARARCGDGPGDAAALAAARAQVATDCDCAASHDAYVRCAAEVARARTQGPAPVLPERCVSSVVRCTSGSTCGKPGFVACCTTRDGATRCGVRKDAARCKAPRGGTACVSARPSCCDACVAGGCATTSTTTTTTVPPLPCGSATYPACGGGCPGGFACQAFKVQSIIFIGGEPFPHEETSCGCTDPATPCGPPPPALCAAGGVCPVGQVCTGYQDDQGTHCGCTAP